MTQKYSNCPPNISDLIVRAELKKKDEALYEWPRKWGWMLKEYQDLKKKLNTITERSVLIVDENKITERRSIGPIPKTVNGEYGWLAHRPEFDLNLYGPVFRSKHGNLPVKFRL